MTNLTIICGSKAGVSEQNVAKIATFLGVPSSYWTLDSSGNAPDQSDRSSGLEFIGVAHWRTFRAIAGSGAALNSFLRQIKAIFVYGWDQSADSAAFLRELTAGAIVRVEPNLKSSHSISVAADSATLSFQWAGLSFEVASGQGGAGFMLSELACDVRVVISRDGEPFFVRQSVGTSELFLSGHEDISNLDARASKDVSTLNEFEKLVPLMMFIRHHFGQKCWQPAAMWACFLIDDPLLRRRYGHLDYRQLLESMERRHYASCIAFIPWNYRRTDPRIAALFARHSDRYSICVHGCDHTRGEFTGSDEQRLRDLTRKAFWRMEQHERLTSLPFAPVMVFPQGLFSTMAMQVLSQSRCLAAANTSPHPVDSVKNPLTLEDCLAPAVTAFSNFPLFTRRYPKNVAECILDLFVGKPLLLVEHHYYFHDNCAEADAFVAKLSAQVPSLQWTDLNTICSRTSLENVDEQHRRHIRFYTDRFLLTNDSNRVQSCVLHRQASLDEQSTTARVNGQRVEVLFEDGYLKLSVTLPPAARAEIALERKHPDAENGGRRQGLLDTTKVLLRRRACEFRDNVLDKSPWVSNVAEQTVKWMLGSS